MTKLNNKGKGIAFAILSIIAYCIPLIILAILNKEKLITSPQTALTTFSVLALVFFFFFARKILKSFCKILTPLGFGSLILLLFSLALDSLLADLVMISAYSLIGSVLAWVPYQIGQVFLENSKAENGETPKTLTVKEACVKMFGQSIFDE